MKKQIEIACSNYQSCLNAYHGGADRIELIENLKEGGCTPSYGMIKYVKENIPLPIYVMIRPRGGNFNYINDEFELMKSDVHILHDLNIDGIVFGILSDINEIDVERCKILLNIWKNKPATFHRAIDMTPNMDISTQQIIDLGFERILTSGGKQTAEEGRERILNLYFEYGKQISIMAGSGITSENIHLFSELEEVHTTCKKLVSNSDLFGEYVVSEMEQIEKLKAMFN